MTLAAFAMPMIYEYWMNKYFLGVNPNYYSFISQFLLYQFIHGWVLHLLSNSIFLYIFWNLIEKQIWTHRYILFFALNTFAVWISLLIFSSWNTVWISGFAMAVMWYAFMHLRKIKHPDYKWAWTFIILNVLIWIWSNVSLIGHLSWALFGMLFFYLTDLTKK